MTQPSPDALFLELAHACGETRRGFDRYVGMGQARRQLLAALRDEGEASQAALQQRLGVDAAAVTRQVKQLEADGAVRRRLDPADNRYTLVALTDAGERLVAALHATHHDYQQRLLAGIDARDQEMVVRVLARLRSNIAATGATTEETTNP